MPPRRKLIVFALTTLLLTIVAGEGLLTLLSATMPTVNALLTRTPIQVAVADERLGWRGNPAYPEHDRLGFRNRDVPRDARIVAMGDSQTYGVGVERDEAWPQQLERLTGLRTYNMGFPGWGPLQSLMLLDEGAALRPSVVVEAFYAGNDLADSFTTVYLRGQLPDLRSTDSGVLVTLADEDRADPWAKKIVSPVDVDPKEKNKKTPRTPTDFLVQNSKLIGLARAIQRAFKRAAAPADDDEAAVTQADENHPAFDNGQVRTLFSPNYRLTALDLADPRIAEGLRISLTSLQRLREQSEAKGFRFVVLLLPTKELVFKPLVAGSSVETSRSYRTVVANEEQFWQTTREALGNQGTLFVDALPALRNQLESGPPPYSETTDGHPNAVGQRVIAELLRAEVERR